MSSDSAAYLAIIYILMAAAAAVGCAARLTYLLSSRAATAIVAIVLWTAAQIVPVHVLAVLQLAGVVHRVSMPGLVGLQTILLAASVLLYIRRRRVGAIPWSDTLPTFSIRHLPLHLKVAGLIVVVTYTLFIVRTTISFPIGYDARTYHYPLALHWLQEGTFAITPQTDWHLSLPGNLEILCMLSFATGMEKLGACVCWPAFALLILCVQFLIVRVFRTSNSLLPVMICIVTSPMICYQVFSGYVDMFGASLMFSAVVLFLQFDEIRTISNDRGSAVLFTAALACGIVAGSKTALWPVVLPLWAVFLLLARSFGTKLRTQLVYGLILTLGLAVPFAFWVGRAWIQSGNPMYPLEVRIGNRVLPGVAFSTSYKDYDLEFVNSRSEWIVHPWVEWKRHPGYPLQSYSEVTGLGGLFATFVIPGVFYAVWHSARRRREYNRVLAVSLPILILLLVLWWFVELRNLRYVLAIPVLASLISSTFLDRLERTGYVLYRCLFVASVALTCAILAFEPMHTIASTIRNHAYARARAMSYSDLVDRLPGGSVILNFSEETYNYALVGDRLSNKVVDSYEVPRPLTPEFLQRRHVDYVFQTFTSNAPTLPTSVPPSARLRLASRQDVTYLDGSRRVLLLWKVSKDDTSTNAR